MRRRTVGIGSRYEEIDPKEWEYLLNNIGRSPLTLKWYQRVWCQNIDYQDPEKPEMFYGMVDERHSLQLPSHLRLFEETSLEQFRAPPDNSFRGYIFDRYGIRARLTSAPDGSYRKQRSVIPIVQTRFWVRRKSGTLSLVDRRIRFWDQPNHESVLYTYNVRSRKGEKPMEVRTKMFALIAEYFPDWKDPAAYFRNPEILKRQAMVKAFLKKRFNRKRRS